jgi:hypothetical protein
LQIVACTVRVADAEEDLLALDHRRRDGESAAFAVEPDQVARGELAVPDRDAGENDGERAPRVGEERRRGRPP